MNVYLTVCPLRVQFPWRSITGDFSLAHNTLSWASVAETGSLAPPQPVDIQEKSLHLTTDRQWLKKPFFGKNIHNQLVWWFSVLRANHSDFFIPCVSQFTLYSTFQLCEQLKRCTLYNHWTMLVSDWLTYIKDILQVLSTPPGIQATPSIKVHPGMQAPPGIHRHSQLYRHPPALIYRRVDTRRCYRAHSLGGRVIKCTPLLVNPFSSC